MKPLLAAAVAGCLYLFSCSSPTATESTFPAITDTANQKSDKSTGRMGTKPDTVPSISSDALPAETDTEIIARIKQACRSLPDYNANQRLTESAGMTEELLSTFRLACKVPSDQPNGKGSEEFLRYWLRTTRQSNPATDGIKEVTIDSRSASSINATVTYSNCGRKSRHKLVLAKENDKWKIDDCDSMKSRMQAYIVRQRQYFASGKYKEQSEEFMSDAEFFSYQREVDDFLNGK